jgi:hypothetical protein
METKETLEMIKAELAMLRDHGHATVKIKALEHYLADLQENAASSMELRKLQHLSSLAQYDAQAKSSIEMFKSVINAGKEALNAALLINGGAAVACLGFLGSVLSKGGTEALGLRFTVPLLLFGFGVLAGALGFGVRYCSQFFYAKYYNKTGNTFNGISTFFAACAYAAFGCGVYAAYLAFATHFSR